MKKWRELLMVLIGSMMMGAGIDCFVQADFGLDPLSLFQAGLGSVLGLTLGTTSQLLMIAIIILLLFADRRRVGAGSVLNSLLVGWFIKRFSPLICVGGGTVAGRLLCLLAGMVLMGMGIGTYVAAGLGEAGMDALMMYLSGKLNRDVNITRIVMDLLLAIAGFLLGGRFGWATILSMAVNGVVIQLTLQIISRLRAGEIRKPAKQER